MRRTSCGILVLEQSPSPAGAGGGQEKPPTPAEQCRALLKEKGAIRYKWTGPPGEKAVNPAIEKLLGPANEDRNNPLGRGASRVGVTRQPQDARQGHPMSTTRRRFLQASAGAASVCPADPSLCGPAFGAEPPPGKVRFGPDLEPVIRQVREALRSK